MAIETDVQQLRRCFCLLRDGKTDEGYFLIKDMPVSDFLRAVELLRDQGKMAERILSIAERNQLNADSAPTTRDILILAAKAGDHEANRPHRNLAVLARVN